MRSGVSCAIPGCVLWLLTVFQLVVGELNNPTQLTEESTEDKRLIDVPVKRLIKLRFTDISMEDTCERESIEVYGSENLIDKICRSETSPFERIYNESMIRIAFTKKWDSFQFSVTYSFTNQDGFIPLTSSGVLKSTNYPDNYPDNEYVVWLITAPPDHTIKLILEDFELDITKNCYYDYVEMYDGGALLPKYCENGPLPVIHTDGNQMKVVFKTGSIHNGKGFRASFLFISSSMATPTTTVAATTTTAITTIEVPTTIAAQTTMEAATTTANTTTMVTPTTTASPTTMEVATTTTAAPTTKVTSTATASPATMVTLIATSSPTTMEAATTTANTMVTPATTASPTITKTLTTTASPTTTLTLTTTASPTTTVTSITTTVTSTKTATPTTTATPTNTQTTPTSADLSSPVTTISSYTTSINTINISNTTRNTLSSSCPQTPKYETFSKRKIFSRCISRSLINPVGDEELETVVDELKQKLLMDKKTTNRYQMKKISAPDTRSSSVAMGYVAITFICFLLGTIVVPEIICLISTIKHGFK